MLVRFLKSFAPNTFINTQHIKSFRCYYDYGVIEKKWTPSHPKPEGNGVYNPDYLKDKKIPDYFENYWSKGKGINYFINSEGKRLTPEEFIGEERLRNYKKGLRYNQHVDYRVFVEAGSAYCWEGFEIVIDFEDGGRMDISFRNIEDCIEAAEHLIKIIGYEGI